LTRLESLINVISIDLKKDVQTELKRLHSLNTPSVRAIRRRYSKALKTKAPEEVLAFVLSLLDGGSWAARVIAWEVLAGHPGAFSLVDDRLVEEMAQGLSDWGSVDLYGVTVLGQAWREGLVTDTRMIAWAKSPDRWLRRLTLVATVPLNSRARGGEGDARRTLSICRLLLDDRDDMVVKAMSWALRELAKRNPQIVEDFISKNEDRLAATVKREVRNKLKTGVKTIH
jgi:3-methyladenine DNA glycosylase AlkD